MKKILTAVALSALIASPALAASPRHHVRDNAPVAVTDPSNNVYLDGEYRGADPDANIRYELRRDTQIGAGA
jgi:hypothetical protein